MQMVEAARNAFRLPELRRKLLFTFFILLVYQFAAHIPVPGVNRAGLAELLTGQAAGFIQILNLLSGGAVSQFSILANGVYPYITAQIILQLLTGVIPALERIQKEPGGQDKINQFTYYLAIPMGLLQAVGQINILQSYSTTPLIPGYGPFNLTTVSVLATMTAGTMFAIWLGNLITEQGIGNGLSLIIFAGIVAQVPRSLGIIVQSPDLWLLNLIMFAALTVLTVMFVVLMENSYRRIQVQYGRRVRGSRQYGGGSTYIPLKVNSAGMIPLIFAQAIVTFPAILAGIFFPNTPFYQSMQDIFGRRTGFWFYFFEFVLVVAFTYFYTDVLLQNQKLADNLQKQGGFIPGLRPGKRTDDFITKVTRRITMAGALYLGIVTIIPGIYTLVVENGFLQRPSLGGEINPSTVISSAGLIIVVGVVVDTLRQLEAQLRMRSYEGFIR